jgi:hypothetical protein
MSRDRKDGRATWQPQGVGSEAYLSGTSQGPPVLSEVEGTPEDAKKDGHIIRARSAQSRTAQKAVSKTSGFPVSWSQQVINDISGLDIPEDRSGIS